MKRFVFQSESLADTDRFGMALAAALSPGAVIALCGTLGAGKTRLVQAIAGGFGVPADTVVSPTFVLCQHYHGQRTLHHFDAYRLNDDDEFLELGPDEYFDSDDVTLIEWADRVERCLPDERLEMQLTVTGEQARQFECIAHGEEMQALLQQLSESL